jgi:hypothetical protein
MAALKTITPESQSEKSQSKPANDDLVGDVVTLEAQGVAHFSRLGWKGLTVVLIVEAIALGALSIPSAFATLGMVAGVITTVGMGFIAIYTSYVVGQVKLAFPQVAHYADAGRLMMGSFGYELIGAMFALELIFLVGSHCLTGTIAFLNLTNNGACSLVFGIVPAIILLLLAIPPSFADVAILGYIDFVSIMLAIAIVVIATGVSYGQAGGAAAANWSAWPKEDVSFSSAFNAVTSIVFACKSIYPHFLIFGVISKTYQNSELTLLTDSFAVCQFSFMDEMHTPQDYVKSIWALGLIEIIIYTLTGALIYVFVGQDVSSPALLSAGSLMAKIAFGIALPVIFISGAINGTVVARYIHGRVYKNSVVRFINTKKGWITWLALITFITITAWVIAEAIPFCLDLLSICSASFISGFTFYFPAMMWFMLIKKGKWYEKKNRFLSAVNGVIFIIGMVVLVAGTYSAVVDIVSFFPVVIVEMMLLTWRRSISMKKVLFEGHLHARRYKYVSSCVMKLELLTALLVTSYRVQLRSSDERIPSRTYQVPLHNLFVKFSWALSLLLAFSSLSLSNIHPRSNCQCSQFRNKSNLPPRSLVLHHSRCRLLSIEFVFYHLRIFTVFATSYDRICLFSLKAGVVTSKAGRAMVTA